MKARRREKPEETPVYKKALKSARNPQWPGKDLDNKPIGKNKRKKSNGTKP